ncbi:unnamed protein product [Sphagnum balticum]
MLVYAYLILGVISASACVGSYAWVYIDHGLSMKDLVFTADRYWSDSSGDFCPHGIHPALNGTCNCTTLMDIEQHNSTTHYDCFTSLQQLTLLTIFCYVPGVQFVMQTETPPWAPALVPGVCAGLTHTAYNLLRKAYIRKYPKSRISRCLHW